VTFAINDDLARAGRADDELRGGRAFSVFETERVHVPAAPGELGIPAPRLRYRYATEFHEDFVAGRVATDPKDEVVAGAPRKLRILPLPEEGRPPGFDGAVGSFTVRAEADRASVDEGETLRLTLTIEGEGTSEAPRLELRGFHVFGTVDEGGHGGRVVRYDIAPVRADVREIPAIPFAFFDPGPPPGYRVARTEPIPLVVRPRAADPTPPPARPAHGDRTAVAVLAAVLVAAAVAAAVVRLRRRRASAPAPDPGAARVRDALARLRAGAASPPAERADALAEFLALYLACPRAAVIGPGLAARLAAKGCPPDLATRVAAALERLVAARYGASDGGRDDVAALLPELGALLPPSP
jgi:hypothetical protein